MQLLENQAKKCLSDFGIHVPHAEVVTDSSALPTVINTFTKTVKVKPLASHPTNYVIVQPDEFQETDQIITRLTKVNPFMTIRSFYIEEYITTDHHISLQVRTNYITGKLLFQLTNHQHGKPLFSEKQINAFLGMRAYQVRDLASDIDLPRDHWHEFTMFLQSIFWCYTSSDITNLHIDRLGTDETNHFIALDASITIDPYALFRQRLYETIHHERDISLTELIAQQANIFYQYQESDTTIITNDTGVSLCVSDELQQIGAQQPNVIEIGDNNIADKLERAVNIATHEEHTTIILIVLFFTLPELEQFEQQLMILSAKVSAPTRLIVCQFGAHSIPIHSLLPNLQIANTIQEAAKLASQISLEEEL